MASIIISLILKRLELESEILLLLFFNEFLDLSFPKTVSNFLKSSNLLKG
jgi:hypothetical protein